MLAWRRAETVLERATRYWISTTSADGRPHLVQQWGAWLEDKYFFEGSDKTRWARNLAREPRASVGAERGSEVVLLQGTVTKVGRPERTLAIRLARTYARKYARRFDYRPMADAWDEGGLWAFTPRIALAWDIKTFGRSATRFAF